ncbi:hypothetical protein CPB85DRAFT_1281587, partial [Mucidula mucida]
MSIESNRFRLILVAAAGLDIAFFSFMLFLGEGAFQPYTSLIYQIIQPICLIIILALRWFYETPLETVQEVARLRNWRWARAYKKPDEGSTQPERPDIHLSDHGVYLEAGGHLSALFAQWVFWLWLLFPVKFFYLTIPGALVVAICIWQCRMSFLGPSHE